MLYLAATVGSLRGASFAHKQIPKEAPVASGASVFASNRWVLLLSENREPLSLKRKESHTTTTYPFFASLSLAGTTSEFIYKGICKSHSLQAERRPKGVFGKVGMLIKTWNPSRNKTFNCKEMNNTELSTEGKVSLSVISNSRQQGKVNSLYFHIGSLPPSLLQVFFKL